MYSKNERAGIMEKIYCALIIYAIVAIPFFIIVLAMCKAAARGDKMQQELMGRIEEEVRG